jgi:two-component system OmpR family sensor kinase
VTFNWKHRTLRFRLALWYGLGGTALLAIFSATIYMFVAQRMARPLSHRLEQDLATIRAHLTVTADGGLSWDRVPITATSVWDSRNPWFELWDENDHLVRRLWPFTETRLSRLPNPPAHGSETLSVFRIANDIPLRVYSTPYTVSGRDQDWMIRVMRLHEPAADALGSLLAIILFSLPVVVALLVAGGYSITRHWLQPLEQMVRQAEGITAENLSQRLPVTDPEDELGRMGTAFNLTLARLEDSFRTLDRFVADASHELRTPLTTLRNVGEVGLRRSRTVEEYRDIIGSMLEESQRLQQLVERLLELASAEGGAKIVHRERIRLDQFVHSCVGEIGILAEYKKQRLVVGGGECEVEADPVLLRQALQNLIDNAMKYGPMESTIHIDVESAEGECRVAVTDEGPGVPAEHRVRLADRFYRVEDSRVRGRGGFGLGLAITKAYMHALGGKLEYGPVQPQGSCFALVLPSARTGHPAVARPQ